MSCIVATFQRIGGCSLDASVKKEFNASAQIIGGLLVTAQATHDIEAEAEVVRNFKCEAWLVCGTGLGDDSLWALDQIILTIDGEKIYVTKG